MSGYLDGDDAFSRLLEHHTDTVKDMTTQLRKAEAGAAEAYGLRNDVKAAEQAYETERGRVTALKAKIGRAEKVYRHLELTMLQAEFASLLAKAEMSDEIPF